MRVVPSLLLVAVLVGCPRVGAAQAVETELPDVTATLVELRQAGGLLHLAVRFTNAGAKAAEPPRFAVDRITLVDSTSKKKYFPLKDADGQYLGGPIADRIGGGRIAVRLPVKQSTVVWSPTPRPAPGRSRPAAGAGQAAGPEHDAERRRLAGGPGPEPTSPGDGAQGRMNGGTEPAR